MCRIKANIFIHKSGGRLKGKVGIDESFIFLDSRHWQLEFSSYSIFLTLEIGK
jgi:hypothetical protein